MEESYLENIENAAALQSARIYEHQLEIIMNTQEQIRSLQHDMKYHLRELANMAKDHSVESILAYVEEMNVLTDNPDEIVYSGNKEIDGNLNYLLKRAKERLKDVSIDLKIPENYLGSQYDINIILSNLLENAITAAENSAEKMLSVKIFLDKSLLYIIIRNSYDGEIKKANGKIITRKQDKALHGYGLKNVKNIVNKYNGTLDIQYDKNSFQVNVMLYIS